jgi:uncharacterized protein YjbI with pentapeptide repeats
VTAKPRRTALVREFSLPDLTPFEGSGLEARSDYDGLDLVDLDLSGQDAGDARFMECRLQRCGLDGLSLRRSRIVGTSFEDCHGTTVDLADTIWRESQISGGRLGAVMLAGATVTDVRVRGINLGFLDLAGAQLQDVVFERCEIGSLDARAATLASVTFTDCTVSELNVTGATLSKVDLSGARLRSLVGVESLRGAIVSHEQLLDLAPILAAQLGLEVRGD